MRLFIVLTLVAVGLVACGDDAGRADSPTDTDAGLVDVDQGDVEEQPGPVVLGFDVHSFTSKCRESMVMAHKGAFHRFLEVDVMSWTREPVPFEINHMDVGSKVAKPGVATILASPEIKIVIDQDAFYGEFAGLWEEQELTIYRPDKTGLEWEVMASRTIKGTASNTSNVDVVFFDGVLDLNNTLDEGRYAFGAAGSGNFRVFGLLTYGAWHIDLGCV